MVLGKRNDEDVFRELDEHDEVHGYYVMSAGENKDQRTKLEN